MKVWTDENGIKWSQSDCVDEYLFDIWSVGYDYSGCETKEDLEKIIDELVKLADKARGCLWESKLFGVYGSPEVRKE